MTDKMTREDVYEMFGGSIPAAAFTFLTQAPPDMTTAESRQHLMGMATLWKSLQKTLINLDIPQPFSAQGRTVMHNYEPLCVMESEKIAAEMVMLLNLGHEKFLQGWAETQQGRRV